MADCRGRRRRNLRCTLGSAKEGAALDAAIEMLSGIAALGMAARARDLTAEQLDKMARGMQRASHEHGRGRAEPAKTSLMSLGAFSPSDDRYAVGIAVPFGQTSAENLTALAERAEFLGVTDIRLAPKRTIVALCPSDTSAETLREAAEELGFVVSPSDRRTKISACPGAPACASGYIAARDLAAEIASENNGLLDGSLHLHVSGCAKGCAHPGKSGLTIVGSENGAGLVVNGTARDAPLAYTARDGARAALGNVAGLVREERRPGRRSGGGAGSPGWRKDLGSVCKTMSISTYDYIHDGNAIYERSFAIIRAEADLSRFSEAEADVAVRMIHACGMVEAAQHFVFSYNFVLAARRALLAGAPILCDAEMVARGVTQGPAPGGNEVICTLRDPQTAEIAPQIGNTRSAAAMRLWGDRLNGAVVAIGNAPTALFYLLEMLEEGAPRPAAIIGMPVGFVGAAESKEALAANSLNIPFAIVRGRMGGSAMTAAAVNALARPGL